ncbi:MAG: McrB family protein [Gammaproteobacteria bacterium]
MNKKIAQELFNIISEGIEHSTAFRLIDPAEGRKFKFANEYNSPLGRFLIENNDYQLNLWLVIAEKSKNNDWYLYVYLDPPDVVTLAEICKTNDDKTELCWEYTAKKRDSENNRRKKIFESMNNGSTRVSIPIPVNVADLDEFLEKIFQLIWCRERANNLGDSMYNLKDDKELKIAIKQLGPRKGWIVEIVKLIEKVDRYSDIESRSSKDLHELIWGKGNKIADISWGERPEIPLTDEDFRRWVAEESLKPVPELRQDAEQHLQKFYDELIEKTKSSQGRAWAKVSRAMAAFYPEYMTSMAKDHLKAFHGALIENASSRNIIGYHLDITDRLNEVLGSVNEGDSYAIAERMTIAWRLYEEYIQKQSDKAQPDDNPSGETIMGITNLIFYGPPGTGKTYNTIDKALKICGENTKGLEREDIRQLFEKKVDDGRIAFTTFHQSMTYEDFIEGIKPILGKSKHEHKSKEPDKEGDPVIYRVEDGIFKELCIKASFSLVKEEGTVVELLNFSSAYDSLVQDAEEEQALELETKSGDKKVIVDSISQRGNLLIRHQSGTSLFPVSKSSLQKLHNVFPDLSEVENIHEEFRPHVGGNTTIYWAVLNAIHKKLRSEKKETTSSGEGKNSLEDKKDVVQSLQNGDYKGKKGEHYVLIIDEINRGSVSQIFGELVTLIEDDKRLGNPEAIQVVLPYSKEPFGVPPNLHIIGTMNTADRSVEALDTALRRRFSFVEVPPDPDLDLLVEIEINDIDLSRFLKVINKRIEKLLDKDHMIGHSYFLSAKSVNDLKAIFQNRIIPLLQEYFFGDYGKIGLVIGPSFFDIGEDKTAGDFFAQFDDYDSSPLLERKVYHLKNVLVDMDDEDFVEAVKEIYEPQGKP